MHAGCTGACIRVHACRAQRDRGDGSMRRSRAPVGSRRWMPGELALRHFALLGHRWSAPLCRRATAVYSSPRDGARASPRPQPPRRVHRPPHPRRRNRRTRQGRRRSATRDGSVPEHCAAGGRPPAVGPGKVPSTRPCASTRTERRLERPPGPVPAHGSRGRAGAHDDACASRAHRRHVR